MFDGQIGIVISGIYATTVVQRYGTDLIAIGRNSGQSWTDIFPDNSSDSRSESWDTNDVRILDNDTHLTITDNQKDPACL